MGQAPNSSPHAAPANTGNGKASWSAQCSWDFAAQGCQDPPEAVVGKDLGVGLSLQPFQPCIVQKMGEINKHHCHGHEKCTRTARATSGSSAEL